MQTDQTGVQQTESAPATWIAMNYKLILGALLLLAALVFSVQNADAVDVKFLAWTFSTSLALVIFGALAAGLIGGWATTSALWRRSKAPQKPGTP
jgi:uncharacterized integral membrane protein